MNAKIEGAMAIIAALIVLFSAMLDPRISAGVAVVALLAFAVYRFVQREE